MRPFYEQARQARVKAGVMASSSVSAGDHTPLCDVASPPLAPQSSSSCGNGASVVTAEDTPQGQSAPDLLYSKLVELGLLRR